MAKLDTQGIDDFYAHLLRAGGRHARPLTAGTVHRVHAVAPTPKPEANPEP